MKTLNFHGRKKSEALIKLRRSFVNSDELSWTQAREKGIPLNPKVKKALEDLRNPQLQKAYDHMRVNPRLQIALDRMSKDKDLKLSDHSPNPLAVMVKSVPITSENVDSILKEFNQVRSQRRNNLDNRHHK
tara:strand:+ start:268 stop:660 length:393 start_codon:yes stop_codon:yes gene_type:complete